MDSTNNLSNSILQNDNINLDSFGTNSSPPETGGILDFLKNISFTTWLIIILILAFLGLNVFAYLAQGTQTATNILSPILLFFSNITRAITGQTLDISAEGGKAVVNTASNITTTGLTGLQEIAKNIEPNNLNGTLKGNTLSNPPQEDNVSNNTLNRAINSSQARQSENVYNYEADEANSSIQGGGKSGWCYIGDDRGFRSCAQVSETDTCMSGDIFPTKDICVNPSLRA